MKNLFQIIATITITSLTSFYLIVSDKSKSSIIKPQIKKETIQKLINNSPSEKIILKYPLLIFKFKNGREELSSTFNLNITLEDIVNKTINQVIPIAASKVIYKYSTPEIKKQFGQNAAIVAYDQYKILVWNFKYIILPTTLNENNDLKDERHSLENFTNEIILKNGSFTHNSCYQIKNFLIKKYPKSYNEREMLAILLSNENYLKDLITFFKISGIEILDRSIVINVFKNEQCFLTKFSNLYSYIVFNFLIQNEFN